MIQLYNPRPVKAQSFAGAKRLTVPKQSLSLAEIVKRFVRREALPVGVKEGIYETRFGDLEKLSMMDIHDQLEHAAELKAQVEAFNQRSKAQAEKDAADAKAAEALEVENRIKAAVEAAKGNVQTAQK